MDFFVLNDVFLISGSSLLHSQVLGLAKTWLKGSDHKRISIPQITKPIIIICGLNPYISSVKFHIIYIPRSQGFTMFHYVSLCFTLFPFVSLVLSNQPAVVLTTAPLQQSRIELCPRLLCCRPLYLSDQNIFRVEVENLSTFTSETTDSSCECG